MEIKERGERDREERIRVAAKKKEWQPTYYYRIHSSPVIYYISRKTNQECPMDIDGISNNVMNTQKCKFYS